MSELLFLNFGFFAFGLGLAIGAYATQVWEPNKREDRLWTELSREWSHSERLEQKIRQLTRIITRRNVVIRRLCKMVPRRGKNGRFEKKVV